MCTKSSKCTTTSSSKHTTQELRKLQKNKHRAHPQPLDHWQTWHDLVVVALNNYCTLVSCVINLGCQKEEGHILFFFSTISRRIEIWLTIADNNQPWLVLLGNLFLRVTITAHLWTGSLIRRNPHLIPVDVAEYWVGPSLLEFLIFQDQVWFFKPGI